MSNFFVFRRAAEKVGGLTRIAVAASISLGITSICGLAMKSDFDHHVPFPASAALLPALNSTVVPQTERQALMLFDELADTKTILFNRSGGCFARAEIMRRHIESKGMHPLKIWAFENNDHPLSFKEPHSYQPPTKWAYHVAVVLSVIDSAGKKQNLVFDPLIFDAPAQISEWTHRIRGASGLTEVTEPDITPERVAQISGVEVLHYTRHGFDTIVLQQFKDRAHTKTVRNVYPAELRNKLCTQDHDFEACKSSGLTWRTAALRSSRTATMQAAL